MGPELILLVAGVAGAGGLGRLWWVRRAQRRHVIRVRTEWVRAGLIVRFGPVGAVCFGTVPRRTYAPGVFGALGIAHGRLVFDGHDSAAANMRVPLDAIRRLGLTTISVLVGRVPVSRRALAIHFDSPDGWRVATVAADAPQAIAQALGDECGLPIHDSGAARDDYGPARSMRLFQDIYGEWSPDREADLYLAPDRLLFNWRDPIPLTAIRRLDVYSRGGLDELRPWREDLLRIEYGTPDDAPDGGYDTVGFGLRGASDWADAIVQRTDVPLTVHAGRKKK